MGAFLVWLVFAACIFTVSSGRDPESSKRFVLDSDVLQPGGAIETGLNAAKDIAEQIDGHNFEGFVGKIAGAASSYLGIISPLVGFVLSLFPSKPSAEFQLIQRLFTEVETRFDQIDLRFNALSRQVGFLATQVQFAALEANINAVQDEFKYISKVTNKAAYDSATRTFSHTYDRSYEDAGSKLFHAIVTGGLTTDDFFKSFEKITQYDRKKTQELMMGTMNLLMRAATLEIAYGKINKDPNVGLRVKTWETRFHQVRDKMNAVDRDIANNYKNHAIGDINAFATQKPKGSLSNQDFAVQLYNLLHTKYYWRDWLVIAAAVHGSDKLAMHACDYYNNDNHGRTIGVSSVDKKHSHLSSTTTLFHGLDLIRSMHTRPSGHLVHYCKNANDGFNQFSDSIRNHCGTYVAAGVFCVHSSDAHIHGDTSRLHVTSPYGVMTAFVFA